MRATIADLATNLGCDWGTANSVLKLLHARGLAKRVDFETKGKGRSSAIWEFPDVFHLDLRTGAAEIHLYSVGTGWEAPEGKRFLGTIQHAGYVWHIYCD